MEVNCICISQSIIATENCTFFRIFMPPTSNGGGAYRVYPLRLCVCVFQICVRPITSLCMMGFKNNLAQIILKTKRCVACKNHVARLKVKVTVGT